MMFTDEEKENAANECLRLTSLAVPGAMNRDVEACKASLGDGIQGVATAFEAKIVTVLATKDDFKKIEDKMATKDDLKKVADTINKVEDKINKVEDKINKVEDKINKVEDKINKVEDMMAKMMAITKNGQIRSRNKYKVSRSTFPDSVELDWPVLESGDNAGNIPSILTDTKMTKAGLSRPISRETLMRIKSAYGDQIEDLYVTGAQLAIQIFLTGVEQSRDAAVHQ